MVMSKYCSSIIAFQPLLTALSAIPRWQSGCNQWLGSFGCPFNQNGVNNMMACHVRFCLHTWLTRNMIRFDPRISGLPKRTLGGHFGKSTSRIYGSRGPKNIQATSHVQRHLDCIRPFGHLRKGEGIRLG